MMVWKVAEINYDIFKDFFGKENLAGKTIYFIEGEIELPKHKITDFINEIKVKSTFNPENLTICIKDENNECRTLTVPLLGLLTNRKFINILVMRGGGLSGICSAIPTGKTVTIYASSREGPVLSFGYEKTKIGLFICCGYHERIDSEIQAEIENLFQLKDKNGKHLDLSEYLSRRVRLQSFRHDFDGVMRALDDEDNLIKEVASTRLKNVITKVPDRKDILTIIKKAENDEFWTIRRNLEDAIFKILSLIKETGDSDTILFLIQNVSSKHRERLIGFLAEMKNGNQSDEVLNLLRDDNRMHSYSAARYLANSRSTESWQEVVNRVVKFPENPQADIIMDMYKRNPELTAQILTESLEKCNADAKPAFIQLLRFLDSSQAFLQISLYLESDSDTARLAAIDMILKISNESGEGKFLIPKLNKIIETDSVPKIKVAAINAVLSLNSKNSYPQIKNAVREKDKSVRQKAVEAMGSIGSFDDIEEIAQCLKDPSKYVRISALSSMWQICQDHSNEERDSDSCINSELKSEISTKIRPYVPEIVNFLCDDNSSVRNGAEKIIPKWPEVFIIEKLIDCMREEADSRLQKNAAVVIGRMHGSQEDNCEISGRLIAGLLDQDPCVRRWCAKALGKRRDPCALEGLETVISDPNECDIVKNTAMQAHRIISYNN